MVVEDASAPPHLSTLAGRALRGYRQGRRTTCTARPMARAKFLIVQGVGVYDFVPVAGKPSRAAQLHHCAGRRWAAACDK